MLKLYYRTRRGEEAINIAEQILESNPNNLPAKLLLVNFYWEMDRNPKAIELCKQAIEDHPENTSPISSLIRMLVAAGQRKQAITLAEQAIGDHPTSKDLKVQLASLYLDDKRKTDAIKLTEEIVRAHPEEIAQKIRLAALYLTSTSKRRKAEGAELARKILEENPENENAVRFLSDFYWRRRHRSEAINLLRENSEKHPQNTLIKLMLVEYYFRSREFEAIPTVLNSITQPNNMKAEYLWINYYRLKGDRANATKKCLDYIQSPFGNQSDYQRYLPYVLITLYALNPTFPGWDALNTVETKHRLRIPQQTSLVGWLQKVTKKKGIDQALGDEGIPFTSSQKIFEAPYLIPVDRMAKKGVVDYGLAYREQGTRIIPEKPKPGKVKHRNPKTWREDPD